LPVHPRSAIGTRQPTISVGNPSSLQNRSVAHNLREREILKLHQTKLGSHSESINWREKQAQTKLGEADKLIIGKERAGATYPRLSSEDYTPSELQISIRCVSRRPVLFPIAAVQPEARPSSSQSGAAAVVFSLHTWAYHLAKILENTQKTSTPKAGMSHGISNMSQKRGLERKLECPLESTKLGLHPMHGGARAKAGMWFGINKTRRPTLERRQSRRHRKLECPLESINGATSKYGV